MPFLGLYFYSDIEKAKEEEREKARSEFYETVLAFKEKQESLEEHINTLVQEKNSVEKKIQRKFSKIKNRAKKQISLIQENNEQEKRRIAKIAFDAGSWQGFKEMSIDFVEEVKGYRRKFDWVYLFLLITSIFIVRLYQIKGIVLFCTKLFFIMLPLLFVHFYVKRSVENKFKKRLTQIYENNKKIVHENVSLICNGVFSRVTSWLFSFLIFVLMKLAFELPSLHPMKIYEYISQTILKTL